MNSDDARLHSRYQPQREADRYIEEINPDRDIEYFILIEPGLGYLIPALRRHCPESKLIALHADNVFHETQNVYPDVAMWFPDSGSGLQEFLETVIPEGASARIIEWRPSVRVYGDRILRLVRESTDFIKRAEASGRTGAAFGRRWVRNFFRNITLIRQTLLYRPMDMPIVITGSGPSLESDMPAIRSSREGVFVLAASSSVPALASGGIMPDMVISTDGGGWALLHLYEYFRTLRGGMLACTLSAALPSQCSAIPTLLLNDGSLWQNLALRSIGVPSVLVGQRGTVTASALELALILGAGGIFLAGMDLAVRDIQSHARPYGFDHLLFGASTRLRPVYSQYFTRSSDTRSGGSHEVYAAWFKNRLTSLPRRIYSLGGNHRVFEDNLPHLSLKKGMGSHDGCFKVNTNASATESRERGKRAADALITALGDDRYAADLCGELAPLLFPSRRDARPGEIAEELRSIIGSAYG